MPKKNFILETYKISDILRIKISLELLRFFFFFSFVLSRSSENNRQNFQETVQNFKINVRKDLRKTFAGKLRKFEARALKSVKIALGKVD